MNPENGPNQSNLVAVPADITRWNWGAVLLGGVWGVGNNTYVSLLAYVPLPLEILQLLGYNVPSALLGFLLIAQIVMLILLGLRGSRWAWRNREWASVEQFKRIQRYWAIGGVFVLCLGVAVIALAVHLNLYTVQSQPTIMEDPPDEALREVIEQRINQAFWADEYDTISARPSVLVNLGFGTQYAENYALQWSRAKTYFQAIVGYDKGSHRLIGYIIDIYVRGMATSGPETARTYLRQVPQEGWVQHAAAYDVPTGFSTVVWNESGGSKLYVHVVPTAYAEPKTDVFPGEAVSEFTEISLGIYLRNNPYYSSFDQFQ